MQRKNIDNADDKIDELEKLAKEIGTTDLIETVQYILNISML